MPGFWTFVSNAPPVVAFYLLFVSHVNGSSSSAVFILKTCVYLTLFFRLRRISELRSIFKQSKVAFSFVEIVIRSRRRRINSEEIQSVDKLTSKEAGGNAS